MKIISKIPLWMLLCLFSVSSATENALTAALPAIASDFNVVKHKAQICSSLYFFGCSLGIITLGRISDIYGRRKVVLAGIALYTITTFLSIFAPNIQTLFALRFIQAFGASVGSVVAQAMARDSYRGSELSYVYASLSIALALVPCVASTCSGYIIEYAGWRYVFAILGTISAILLIIYIRYLPETNPYMALQSKYFSIFKIVIKDKILLLYGFIVGSFNGITFGFYMEVPFLFIKKMGIHPSSYGKLFIIFSIASACGSFTNRYLVKSYVDTQKIMTSGLILSFIGCSILLIANKCLGCDDKPQYLNISLIFLPMVLHLIGHSLVVPLCLRHALEDYGKINGTAGSIFGSLYYCQIALISFIISKLNFKNAFNFTALFFILTTLSILAFYYIQCLNKKNCVKAFSF